MDKQTKTLIVVIIILIAALGVTSGLILQGYLNKNTTAANNTTNSTTVSQSNNTKNSTPNYIGEDAAINIAKKYYPNGPHIVFNAELITNGNNAYYLVTAKQYNEAGNYSSTYSNVVKVDAVTGQVL